MVCQNWYCRVTVKAPVKRRKEERREEKRNRASCSLSWKTLLSQGSRGAVTREQEQGERESMWFTVKARRRKEIERRGERKEVLFVMTVDSVSSPALPGVVLRMKVSVGRIGDGQVLNGNEIVSTASREGRRKAQVRARREIDSAVALHWAGCA